MSPPFDLGAIEKAIECIEGVLQAKVVGSDTIEEIHVLSRPSKPPKLLVRDIETLLQAKFNLGIDHKKVSVVTFDVGEEEERFLVRPVLWSINWRKSMDTVQVEVEVKLRDKICRGNGSDSTLRTKNYNFLIACATMECINQMLGGPTFAVNSVSLHRLQEAEVVLVFVEYRGMKRGGEMLVGSALVRDDAYEAVARATLDAVNRKLTFYKEYVEGEQGGSR